MKHALPGLTLLSLVAVHEPADAAQAVNGLDRMRRDICHSFKLDCRKRHAAPPARRSPAAAKPARPRPSAAGPAKPVARPETPAIEAETPARVPTPVARPAARQPAKPVPRARPLAAAVDAPAAPIPVPRDKPVADPAGSRASAPTPRAVTSLVPVPRDRPALLPALPPVAGGSRAVPDAKAAESRIASIAPGEAAAGPPGCEQGLRAARVQFDAVPATFGNPACPVADPVRLHAVETPSGLVSFPEGPIFSCRFARQFAAWVSETGSAVVLAQTKNRLEKMATGPGYDCRRRNGDSSAKMSEHAAGDAVDITSMTVAGGTSIRMADAINPASPSYAVLRALRTTACGYFTTVLGPGANEAHKEHYHFDLGVHGKSGNYRICE